MKASSVSLLLGVSVLLLSGLTDSAVSLDVRPNRPQFFTEESVSLSCVEDGQTVDGWTVKRRAGGHNENFGRFDGSSCIVSNLSQSDTGVYWCETSSGQTSDQINITVTHTKNSQVILEIYALPVMEGSDVTLRCRTKDKVTNKAFFIRDGSNIGSGPEGQFTIRNIQRSDEGLYWCYFDQSAESPRRWLSVRASPLFSLFFRLRITVGSLVLLVLLVLVLVGVLLLRRNQTDAVRSAQRKHTAGLPLLTAAGAAVLLSGLLVSADSSLSVLRLCCHLVVFCPYCVSTGLMLSICCSRKTGNKPAVSMEMTQRVGGSDELDGDYEDITADVTTEHAF